MLITHSAGDGWGVLGELLTRVLFDTFRCIMQALFWNNITYYSTTIVVGVYLLLTPSMILEIRPAAQG